MSELKPCPFCGGEAKVLIINFSGQYIVKCENKDYCPVRPYTIPQRSEEKAIDAWNRRSE